MLFIYGMETVSEWRPVISCELSCLSAGCSTSDFYVAYQFEDKLMHKVTHCAPLDPLSCFCGIQHCNILRTYN